MIINTERIILLTMLVICSCKGELVKVSRKLHNLEGGCNLRSFTFKVGTQELDLPTYTTPCQNHNECRDMEWVIISTLDSELARIEQTSKQEPLIPRLLRDLLWMRHFNNQQANWRILHTQQKVLKKKGSWQVLITETKFWIQNWSLDSALGRQIFRKYPCQVHSQKSSSNRPYLRNTVRWRHLIPVVRFKYL